MKLSVIVPVYNEKATILAVLDRIRRVPVPKEIILVDDGSTDGGRDILKEVQSVERKAQSSDNGRGRDDEIKVILKERNEGKGAAIRTGLNAIAGDVVVIQDADLEYDPMDWIPMLDVLAKGRVKVVYGSRILGRNAKSSLSFYLGGRLLSWIANLLYNARITDEPTCYKMFTADVIRSIRLACRGFEFCPEVTAKVRKRGYRIAEVPIRYHPRSIREGKKIRWSDGWEAIWTLFRYWVSD